MERVLFIVASILFVCIRVRFHQPERAEQQEIAPNRERVLVTLFSSSLLCTHLWWIFQGTESSIMTLVQWVGAIMMLISLPILYWVHYSLGTFFSARLVLQNEHQIIRTGPYKWVRHPMYSIGFLYLIGAGLLSTSNWVLLLPTTCFTILVTLRLKDEEMMLAHNCPEYQTYKQHTGRFLPKLW